MEESQLEAESKQDRILRLARERCQSGKAASMSEARRFIMQQEARTAHNVQSNNIGMNNAKLVVRLIDRQLLTLETGMATSPANAMEVAEYTMTEHGIKPETVKLASYQVDGKEKFVYIPKKIGSPHWDWDTYNGAK